MRKNIYIPRHLVIETSLKNTHTPVVVVRNFVFTIYRYIIYNIYICTKNKGVAVLNESLYKPKPDRVIIRPTADLVTEYSPAYPAAG